MLLLYLSEIIVPNIYSIIMRPKFHRIGCAYGLPKIRIDYQDISPFRPVTDLTSTPHYGIAKCLASLLDPLTIKNYSAKDFLKQLNL